MIVFGSKSLIDMPLCILCMRCVLQNGFRYHANPFKKKNQKNKSCNGVVLKISNALGHLLFKWWHPFIFAQCDLKIFISYWGCNGSVIHQMYSIRLCRRIGCCILTYLCHIFLPFISGFSVQCSQSTTINCLWSC